MITLNGTYYNEINFLPRRIKKILYRHLLNIYLKKICLKIKVSQQGLAQAFDHFFSQSVPGWRSLSEVLSAHWTGLKNLFCAIRAEQVMFQT